MKKTFTPILLAIITLSITSCFKSWTCECTSYDNYASFATTSILSSESVGFKSKLKKQCEAQNRYNVSGDDTSIQTCVLK